MKSAVLAVFRDMVSPQYSVDIVTAFEEGAVVSTGEDVPSVTQAALADQIPALQPAIGELTGGDTSAAAVAAAVEFVLEGLHLSKRLNKDASSVSGGTYRAADRIVARQFPRFFSMAAIRRSVSLRCSCTSRTSQKRMKRAIEYRMNKAVPAITRASPMRVPVARKAT